MANPRIHERTPVSLDVKQIGGVKRRLDSNYVVFITKSKKGYGPCSLTLRRGIAGPKAPASMGRSPRT